MNEIIQNVINMAEAGNWAGILTFIGVTILTIVGSVGGVSGIIALIYKMFSNKKFLNKIKDLFTPLIDTFNSYKELSELKIKELKDELKNAKTAGLKTLTQLNAIKDKEEAFYLTVLNTDELRQQYADFLKQIENEKKKINTKAENIETIIESSGNEIKEQVKSTDVKPIKSISIKLKEDGDNE